MRKISKHNSTKINIVNLAGGLNVSVSGSEIAINEMQECENFLYRPNSQLLRGRGGLSPLHYNFYSDIKKVFYDVDTNMLFIFLVDLKIYQLVLGQDITYLGNLTGDMSISSAKFQNKLWIASGGKLQYYDYSGNESGFYTVLESPVCNIVFERFSRLAVGLTGSDKISFSAIGDGTSWEENTNDKSSSQWIDVGYGDSGDILAIVPLATDLIILKSNGKIYQFAGDADSATWNINNIVNGADCVGENCATNIGNSVVFLSLRGLKSLNTTLDYGNIAQSDIADKFNAIITSKLQNPRIFHLRRSKNILIQFYSGDKETLLAYNYGLGAATMLKFAVPITQVLETSDEVLIVSGKIIYKWSEVYTSDDGSLIEYKIKLKDIESDRELLLKKIETKFKSDHAGNIEFNSDRLNLLVPSNNRKIVNVNHSTEKITIVLSSETNFEFERIVLEVAEL